MNVIPISSAGAPRARTLPHNLSAEASILGGVIVKNAVLGQLAELETDDFYHPKHRVVWQAIRNLEATSNPIDVVTLETEIEKQGKLDAIGGIAFLGELALQVPTPENVISYAASVRLAARNRMAILALSEATERAYDWPHEPSELISEITGQLKRIEKLETKSAPTFTLITIDGALDDLEAQSRAPVFRTPFPALNDAIGMGGLLGTQVYTVAAGTGRGKTSWVAELAAGVADDGTPVLISVHELGPGYFVARKAAGVLGCHSNDIIRWKGVTRREVLGALPYGDRMLFLKRPTLQQLRDATDHVAQRFGRAPLLIVDYLQKLADEIASRQQRPDLRIATNEASSALLEIGERTGAAVMAVSSIGRGKKELTNPRKLNPYALVEVAKESGAVEYDGAAMIVLSLDDNYDGDEQIGTMTVAKARFGRACHIDARYHGSRGTWRDCGEVPKTEVAVTPKAPAAAKEAPPSDAEMRRRLIADLQKSPARGKDHLVERVVGNKSALRRAYDGLFVEGVIAKIGTGIALSELGRQRLMEGV